MSDMHIHIITRLCGADGSKFMGPGPRALMEKIAQLGSIRKAASALDMSYAKAHRILGTLEKGLGIKLLNKYIGGSSYGGAELTKEALEFLRLYDAMEERIKTDAQQAFAEFAGGVADLAVRAEAAESIADDAAAKGEDPAEDNTDAEA